MLAIESTRIQAWSHLGLGRFLFIFLMSLLIDHSYANAIPVDITKDDSRNDESEHQKPSKTSESSTLDFAAAMGIIMAAVMVGTALICVFAHCWRQIIEYGRRVKSASAKRRTEGLRREDNAWVFLNGRGVSNPCFERLKSRLESPSHLERARWPGAYAEPGYYSVSPGLYKSSKKPASQPNPPAQWRDSSTTLPGWVELDGVERPASAACVPHRL